MTLIITLWLTSFVGVIWSFIITEATDHACT
jgi:hypothetical protein